MQAFKYCPRCSNTFKQENGVLVCTSCGLHFYNNPKPCTSVVFVNSKGEYLLVKRAVDPKKGWWDIPGGFVEDGETFEQSAKREVKEELGLTVDDLQYFGSFYDKYLYQNIVYSTLAVVYTAKLPDGTITPDDDVADYAFFKPNEIPLDRLAFPSMIETFKQLNAAYTASASP